MEKYFDNNVITHKLLEVLMCFQAVWFFTFGELDDKMKAFLVLIVIDFITGIRKAIYQKNLSCSCGMKGIEKKVRILLVLAVAKQIDKIIGITFDSLSASNTIMAIYACNEGLSILENISSMGTWVPDFVREKLIQAKKSQETHKECKDCVNKDCYTEDNLKDTRKDSYKEEDKNNTS